jgi:hypothetical protein
MATTFGTSSPRKGSTSFCGADIVVKEAADDTRLLTTYGGKRERWYAAGAIPTWNG